MCIFFTKTNGGRLKMMAIASLVAVFSLSAQEQNTEQLMDMSLEDLLGMEVSTASKKDEKIVNAPGILSVITAEEIKKFGANSLFELLERLPGSMLMADNAFPQGNVSFRGDVTGEVSNHVLVLLNGRPMRESTHGASYTPLYTTFPINMIEKIEVIRGPGSVLYGTNAYSGVINIITKGLDDKEFVVDGGVGSYGTKSIQSHGSFSKNDFYVSGGINYKKSDNLQTYDLNVNGSDSSWVIDEPYNNGQDIFGANLNAGFKGLKLTSFYGSNDFMRDEHPKVLFSKTEMKSDYMTTDLGYEHEFGDKVSVSVNGTLNYMHLDNTSMIEQATDELGELTGYFNPIKDFNITAGYMLYRLNCWGKMVDPATEALIAYHFKEYVEYRHSWYLQLDYTLKEKFKFIGGAQLNKVEDNDLDVVPRLGAILNFTDNFGTKLLFGQAFRSPFATERTINIPGMFGIKGSKSLSPEKMTTFDWQVFLMKKSSQISCTYFYNNQKDLISLQYNTAQQGLVFTNTTNVSSQGLELEWKLKFLEDFYVTGSFVYTYCMDEDKNQVKDIIPTEMLKLGFAWDPYRGITLGIYNNLFNKPEPIAESNPSVVTVHPEAEVMSYLTAKLSVDIAEIANLKIPNSIALEVYGTNLLDQDIYMQNSRRWDNTYARQIGPAVYANLLVGF